MAMTSVLAEAVRELAAALKWSCRSEAEDTGISAGEVFVAGKLVRATEPCWFVYLGPNLVPFKDHVAAMMFLKALGVRDET